MTSFMKKTTLYGLLPLLIASIFTACDLSYFDNDIEDFVWDASINAPLGHAEYTLSELFDELDIDNDGTTEDGVLFFTHTESFNTKDNTSDDVVEIDIPTIDIEAVVDTPQAIKDLLDGKSSETIIIDKDIIVPNDPHSKSFSADQDLTAASFDGGILSLTFNNEFASDITVSLEIPSLTKKNGGESYKIDNLLISASSISATEDIDLDEYNADFTHNGNTTGVLVNHFATITSATIHLKIGQTITDSAQLIVNAQLTNATTDVVYGDFKQESFNTEDDEIALDFFDTFGEGDIEFSNASMELKVVNGFGFPIGIDVTGIEADNGTSTIALTYDGTQNGNPTHPVNTIVADGISTLGATPDPNPTPTVLDNSNSNINTLLSLKPNSFILNLSGAVNPVNLTPNENFFASTNEGIQVEVNLEVPLEVSFDDVKIELDPIEFDIKEDLEDFEELEKIDLRVATVNHIPLTGTIHLNFVNNGADLGLVKSIALFKAASVDAEGYSSEASNTPSELSFDSEEIELLKKATDIELDITFNSPKNPDGSIGSSVKLKGSDSIKIIISALIGAEISIDDEEGNNN